MDEIPFNRAFIAGKELFYISQAVIGGELKGDGPFTDRCHRWLEENCDVGKALLTHSCTGALEMAAILEDIGPDDEVLMPAYTFTSTANAFLLRGAKITFVDIRPDTLNIDEKLLAEQVTSQSKAICPVHYAGVACEMDSIMDLAAKEKLVVIEDAAHAILATYKGRQLGSIGDIGTFSFHQTKNFSSGEGGALLLNNKKYFDRAEIVREKGTNRSQFFRGEVDKYTWVDIGSSYLPSEIVAAFLFAQFENAEQTNQGRLDIWHNYQEKLKHFEELGYVRLPVVPKGCVHNAHLFYFLCESPEERTSVIEHMRRQGVYSVFHYVPLHLSPMGEQMGYKNGQLPITEDIAERLVRLPLYGGMTLEESDRVVESLEGYFFGKTQKKVVHL